MGVVGENRIYIVYENNGRIEIYKINDTHIKSLPTTTTNMKSSLLFDRKIFDKIQGKRSHTIPKDSA